MYTNRIVADILSPIINKMHLTEPKSSKYTINTKTSGNFSIFLQLINFNFNNIPENKIPYNNIQTLLKNSLESEDQLLNIFNSLYNSNSNYSYMYDYVEFDSVSNDGVASFIHRYNYKDLTQKVWHLISRKKTIQYNVYNTGL